ncbi:MAG TPA: hypothetical protein VGR59_06820, partial [Gemmatimonadaceae bacterium]|nr:hypothetical protein [Gemmatimonadaceae bacterium]
RDELPRWMQSALREPVAARTDHVHAIMALVRGAADAEARLRRVRRRRVTQVRALGLALVATAAGVAILLGSVRAMWQSSLPEPLEASATFIGDSIDPALHDTFDLVRFALRTRGASRVVLAGDFNAWSTTATPLSRSSSPNAERWAAVVALRCTERRFAFLVDGTRWVRAPRAAVHREVRPPGADASSHRDST